MKVKSTPNSASGLLLDIDGVLHVGDQALPGAAETLEALGEARPLPLLNDAAEPKRAA